MSFRLKDRGKCPGSGQLDGGGADASRRSEGQMPHVQPFGFVWEPKGSYEVFKEEKKSPSKQQNEIERT
ncbi:hypothetical protein CEXT_691871 [Caerostris extrusa]|uniref:Uncharacterized protein n=1 Tax=Caerostris extrusa TaxID=172846 RepID=A0AAV4VFX4_CAEEX|nr:hypothetical protein CEXT_691871 [Caerostris extrusa]